MVYKRPKHVKTNLTNEVTGPWLDNQFFTDSLQSDSSLSLNGDDNSILKNSLATLWGSFNTKHVRQISFICYKCSNVTASDLMPPLLCPNSLTW